MAIPATEALIVSMFFVSFLEGVFVMLLGTGVYLALARRHHTGHHRKWTGLAACGVSFVLSTTHFIMVFYQYFSLLGGTGRFDDVKKFAKFSLASIPVAYLNVILAGALLTWKAWTVYGHDWRIVVPPAISIIGIAVAAFGYVGVSFNELDNFVGTTIDEAYAQARVAPIRKWALASIGLSTATSISLTLLIMAKLIAQQRSVKNIDISSLTFEILVIIESGAVYSFAWVAYLVLYLAGNNATVVALDIISQLSGIVPTLIVVMAYYGMSLVEPPKYSERRPSAPSTRVETSMNFGAGSHFSLSMGDTTELGSHSDSKKSKERLYVST